MVDFMAHKYDVLLATTIIENGLDIPNANTMIINRADRYGLSQLYQLRGRVGRSDRRAYAYLLIPPEDNLSPVAKKRLAAIREFSDLGSGFRVAALDLEIRGAGNLLGGEQSGQIEAVGFDMYMKLLEQTIKELKGEEIEDEVRANVNLRVDLRIDETYIPDMNQRLTVYRRMAGVRSEAELQRSIEEVARPLRPAARLNREPGRIRLHPRAGRPDRHRIHRPRRPDRRLKVQARSEAGSGLAVQDRPGAQGRAIDAAGHVEARICGWPEGARPGKGRRPVLVDGPGDRGPGHRRLHEGGDSAARKGRPPRRGGRVQQGLRPAARLERRRPDTLKY